MNNLSNKQVEQAFEILRRYEGSLMQKMAAEIVERKEEFESPSVGGAEEIIDKYYHLLSCLCWVRSGLAWHSPHASKLPVSKDKRKLGTHEFRCLRCRTVISVDADGCPECGWTWG